MDFKQHWVDMEKVVCCSEATLEDKRLTTFLIQISALT